MSIFDKFRNRKKKSTRQFIGVSSITDYSLNTYNQGELVYYRIKPNNLAVLSNENIGFRIFSLTTILKSVAEIEMCCLNSRESFENNKLFLKERIAEEADKPVPCVPILDLCEKDLDFLEKIHLKMATAREFLLILRFRREKPSEIITQINRFEKLLKEQGFEAHQANKPDIKKIVAVYFEQNITQIVFDDIDGQRWANNL